MPQKQSFLKQLFSFLTVNIVILHPVSEILALPAKLPFIPAIDLLISRTGGALFPATNKPL